MSSKSTLSVDADIARTYITNHIDKRQVNKIQHSFPSPRYWTERDVPVHETLEDRQKLLSTDRDSMINLYVGSPFCIQTAPAKCGYCLFPVEVFEGSKSLDRYFDYMKREIAMYEDALHDQTIGSVFFGGGTANLYKSPKYPELMELVNNLCPNMASDAHITLEGIPQLFTRDKMKTAKEAGMNRVSVGVQQINEELNALSGRKQTTKHVIDTLAWSQEFEMACNLDLIFGWPQQTVSTMVEDLETLIEWGVYDITHYELNVGGPTDFALNRYHELPSTLSNLEMYRVSRDLLTSHGYEQITAYNYRKPGDPAGLPYEEGVTHRFDNMDTVGIGYAAITFFGDVSLDEDRSWSYINWRNNKEYMAAIDEGRFPVECGFRHEQSDFKLAMLFRNLFGLELDRSAYQSAFGVDAYDEFEGVWTALEEWEFAEVTPEKIRLVGDGPFYTPMVQTLLAEKRYSDLRQKVTSERKEVLA